jgi:hypothetical protein
LVDRFDGDLTPEVLVVRDQYPPDPTAAELDRERRGLLTGNPRSTVAPRMFTCNGEAQLVELELGLFAGHRREEGLMVLRLCCSVVDGDRLVDGGDEQRS